MPSAKSNFLNRLYNDDTITAAANLPARAASTPLTFTHPHYGQTFWHAPLVIALLSAALFFGVRTGQRHYLVTSLLLMGIAFGAVCLRFERRHPTARELVVIAVLVALAVVGRSAFFMFAEFKPVAALVIVSGVAFGSDVGFLVGATAALTSNVFFTQGPWTPWQMLGFGCIGWVAGLLAYYHLLRPRRLPLCIFGFVSVLIIYGGIMNPTSIIMYGGKITVPGLIAVYTAGLPMDLTHATVTVIFLGVLGLPILRKLYRLQSKFGLFT